MGTDNPDQWRKEDSLEQTLVVGPPPQSGDMSSPYPKSYPSAYKPPKRYRIVERLGGGGCGEVFRVFDRQLERNVAMKLLRYELVDNIEMRGRFMVEAHITAQLQHPGIVSVHDRGELSDGGLWFTMEEVRGRTLAEVIADHHFSGGDDAWPLRRLVDVFTRAVQAVGYAHRHGVVHRDLKPDNLMIGEFGEVLVMDWGLARRLNEEGDLTRELPSDMSGLDLVDSVNTPPMTAHGAILGTPTYMPPEQARGERQLHGPHSDVYSLGAILYLILTGRPPYGGTAQTIWRQVVGGPPPHVGAVRPSLVLPEALVSICTRAMQRDVMRRYLNAEQMVQALQAWLEGQRRRERALEMLAEARRYRPEVADLREQARSLRRRGAEMLAQIGQHEPIERLRPGWALEDAAASLEREATLMETRWLQAVHGALMVEPELGEAHAALANHYRRLLSRAERTHAFNDAARYEVLLRAHHKGDGEGDAFMRGEGMITLLSEPAGARVMVDRYELADRRLSAKPQGELGVTPLRNVTLARGSYLLRLQAPGCEEVRYPVLIERGEHWNGVPPEEERPAPILLPREDDLAEDDCYVPAGWFWAGGDPEATDCLPQARIWVDGFIIKRHPVTNADYLAFLNHLLEEGREEEALAACPRAQLGVADTDAEQLAFGRAPNGQFVLDSYAGRPRWQPDWPVVLIDWFSACAYAQWYAERNGKAWRLPSELEREKAARGVDGRKCPWGDYLDARFCHVAQSQERDLSRAPITAQTHDVSPYRVTGLAGNTRDWCLDEWTREGSYVVDRRNVVPSAPPTGDKPRIVRGGAWSSATEFSRSAARFAARPTLIRSSVGLRLVRDLMQ